jgi:hypothetical protein
MEIFQKLVSTYNLAPIVAENGEELLLRVEVWKSLATPVRFSARVWRIDSYRIRPTFPQREGIPSHRCSDELLAVEDAIFGSNPALMDVSSEEELINVVLNIVKCQMLPKTKDCQ